MGGMGSTFRPKGLRVILPFACFLGLFLFLFLFKKGGGILYFHSLPIEHPGYKRGSGWLSPHPIPGHSSNHSTQLSPKF